MSQIKMEAKKNDTWKIDLLEKVEMVPCGNINADVKALYIKSWSVAEHKKRFSSIQRLAFAIKDLQLANTMKTLKMFGGDMEALRSFAEKNKENVEKAEELEPMELLKKQIYDIDVFFRGCESEVIFGLFKTFFQESTSKMVFVHEAMEDEHAISIDALFNMIAPEDLYYLFASFYVLFLEPLLTPRKR